MWQLEQLQLLQQKDPQLVHDAINQLLNGNDELKRQLVVGAYLDDQINLGKAAEL